MKPLEFKIEKRKLGSNYFTITFYYEKEDKEAGNNKIDFVCYGISNIPNGLELNKHYSITDIYGYVVEDDREGL